MTTCLRADAGAWLNYPFLTRKERDNETGLDCFLARYYSSTQGRYTILNQYGLQCSGPSCNAAGLWDSHQVTLNP